jgi:anti-sigma B factor antagonist
MAFAADDIELHVRVARVDGAHVVTVTGELDLHTTGPIRDTLAPLAEKGDGDLILDLTGISFVDSTALGVLVSTAKRLRERDAELVVVTDDPRLRRLLEITGLLGAFAHEPTLADAVERVAAARDGDPSPPRPAARRQERRQEVRP